MEEEEGGLRLSKRSHGTLSPTPTSAASGSPSRPTPSASARADEVAREMEMMKAVSFMYVRPPGYNAESAKAAEVSDERKREDQTNTQQDPSVDGASNSMPLEAMPLRDQSRGEKRKPVPKDVFGRALPTEEQFEILKNAPRYV
ncbi:zinc knuckle (CCHC-type) family protein [Actinidia rufa]|uniref:Zinc knuckle (CCHC-type) family protein n=1 Tax=Actinidia rufa TaxID=165716 RepID=A0A7J0GZU2_9ERIC|nr:zinc knuckle (CCHC-type) family protein [Actinidia rufa]